MTSLSSLVSRIVAIACLVLAGTSGLEATQPVPDRESALEAFGADVNSYVALHRRLEAPLAPLDEAGEPLHSYVSRQILASTIRRARLTARQGSMFRPAVSDVFRATIADVRDDLRPWLLGLHRQYLIMPDVHPPVNEPCAPAETHEIPDVLLRTLPPLAPELQYRLVHFDLVLWDVHAYLIVDFLPDAFRLADAATSSTQYGAGVHGHSGDTGSIPRPASQHWCACEK
jgi:hypothetical protein